jgi:hypothetical protein
VVRIKRAAIVVAVIATAAALAGGTRSAAAAGPVRPASYQGPRVALIAAQRSITAIGFPVKKGSDTVRVFLDPGIWLASLGGPLRFDVSRAGYGKPLTLTQVISVPGRAAVARPLPATMLDGWNGLKGMMRMTVRNRAGKVVASAGFTMCPDTYDAERATPDGPASSPYPQQCGAFDPFPLGQVWGIAKDWAVDPVENVGSTIFTLTMGQTYTVTENIMPRYMRWFAISPRDATASVEVTVVPQSSGPPPPPARSGARAGGLPAHAAAPLLKNPPKSVLPDLVALPAWDIVPAHVASGDQDWLDFGATVWVGGNGPLDVEAFRSGGSPVMPAYQYFYRDGKVIGRVRAGTMGFDSAKGHNHWHFEQFAQYRLLGADKKLVVRSAKVGFCIAPSDPVNLLLPGAVWQPSVIGFTGQCGSPTALWVREMLPLGWGDTYEQYLAGQAFNITSLPNGVYYIEVIANPDRVLRETNLGNDVALRKIIISGVKGHRHVKVPAYDGIDAEG